MASKAEKVRKEPQDALVNGIFALFGAMLIDKINDFGLSLVNYNFDRPGREDEVNKNKLKTKAYQTGREIRDLLYGEITWKSHIEYLPVPHRTEDFTFRDERYFCSEEQVTKYIRDLNEVNTKKCLGCGHRDGTHAPMCHNPDHAHGCLKCASGKHCSRAWRYKKSMDAMAQLAKQAL